MKYLATVLLLLSSMTMAGGYAVVSAGNIDTEISDHSAVFVGIGVTANDFLSAEITALATSSEEDYQGVELSFNYFYNASIIASLPLGDSFSVYGKLGYSSAEAEASYMGYSETVSQTSESYGVGAKFVLTEAWTVSAEYNQYYTDVSGYGLKLQRNF